MKVNNYIEFKLKSNIIRLTIDHCYKLSKGKYLHFPIFVVSFGSNGFGIHILGIYFGFSVNKK